MLDNNAMYYNPKTGGVEQYMDGSNGVQGWAPVSAQTAGDPLSAIQSPDSGYTPYAAPDPYAKWGGQSAYNNLISGFDTQKQNIYGTTRDATAEAARSRDSSITEYLRKLRYGQDDINNRGVQNELSKKQGYGSILDMVGRGISSGQTLLANKNAQDSSAAQAIAQAYGRLGNRQMGQIGNQYELENQEIQTTQNRFNDDKVAALRGYDEDKTTQSVRIAAAARDKLAELDAWAADKDLPTRIQVEQEKERIRAEVMQSLSQFDPKLTQGVAAVNPSSVDDRRRAAFGMANDGVAANQPFNFSTEAPAQFQNSGFSGQLPIFTFSRQRREA